MVRGVRSPARPPFAVRFAYYAIGWRPHSWTAWAEAFVLSDAWPLVSTARNIVVYVLALQVFVHQHYSWRVLLFVASVLLLPWLLVNDRDIQRRREIARLRGSLPRPTPLLVLAAIALVGICVLRSGAVVDERARWIVGCATGSSLAAMITWQLIRNRRYDRLLPPIRARPMLFADR
jgi:hypothetical protein